MGSLLERTITSHGKRLVLLAPSADVPASFANVTVDAARHDALLEEMQALRGKIYLEEGAVRREQLSLRGLHRTPEDDRSWHLLMVDEHRRVSACAWYLQHDRGVQPEQLRVQHTPLARNHWRRALWSGVSAEITRARREFLRYVEVGGWAVAKEAGGMSDGLVIALAGYSLGQLSGGCLGITTATVRHCSSTILRKLGGARLDAAGVSVPSYYDPRYDCEMEILRFDSRRPNAKYSPLVDSLRQIMTEIPVIAAPGLRLEIRQQPARSVYPIWPVAAGSRIAPIAHAR
jgi:hypothetical protein